MSCFKTSAAIKSGIYQITIGNKSYVGSSRNIRNRIYAHISLLRKGKHHSQILQRCYDKYKTFEYKILLKCPIDYLEKLEDWCLQNPNINSDANINKSAKNPKYIGQKKVIGNFKKEPFIKKNKTLSSFDIVNLINDFNLGASLTVLSKKYNTCRTNVNLILNGKSRKKYKYLINPQRLNQYKIQYEKERSERNKKEHRNRAILIIEEYNNYVLKHRKKKGYTTYIDNKYNFPVGTASDIISGQSFPELQSLIIKSIPSNVETPLIRNNQNKCPLTVMYGGNVYEFDSIRECSRKLNLNPGNISLLASGKIKSYKGLIILKQNN